METKKRPAIKRIKYYFLYLLVKTILLMAYYSPRKLVLYFCGFLGGVSYYLVGDARNKTLRHLTMVYGHEKSNAEIQTMAKQVFHMIGKNAGDVMRSVYMKELDCFKKVVNISGEEHLLQALAAKQGIIVLTAHVGAFDLVGTYLAMMDYRPQIIGTRLKDERLNQLITKNRSRRGAEAIERGKDTLKVVRNLKSGGVVAMLIDQDTKVKSVFVDFMGMPASTPVGAALFAIRTGAKVIPMAIYLDQNNRQQLKIFPEVHITITGNEADDLFNNTLALSKATEMLINQDPTQWVWMHERWKTQPQIAS
ncbi:MAG: lysophospholipid acyltransferase family protein [Cecembia sp.]